MVHADQTIMEKTLAKSKHLVKLRGVLYEPKCGEPTCFHEWFRNRDHNSNPVREHIQMFDAVYPIVRNTIAVNLAGATDRRRLLRAYRVYCRQVFLKVTNGDKDTETEISTLRWWMKNAIALAEKPFPGIKEFENVFVTHCSARYDGRGFFFISKHRGASIIVRFLFYVDIIIEHFWTEGHTTSFQSKRQEEVCFLAQEQIAKSKTCTASLSLGNLADESKSICFERASITILVIKGLQEEEQWHLSITTTTVIISEENVRTLVKEAIARKMSLCEFIEIILWPFVDFLNDQK